MEDTSPLREKRHKLLVDARTIVDKADEENRIMTDEENERYKRYMAEYDDLTKQIEQIEKRNEIEAKEKEQQLSQEEERQRRKIDDDPPPAAVRPQRPQETEEYRALFEQYLIGNQRPAEEELRTAMSAGTQTAGGYLYASEQFTNELIRAVDDMTIVRDKARTFKIDGTDSIGAPVLATKMADAVWGTEMGRPSEDTSLALGKRQITPHPLAAQKPVSKVLLRKAPMALEIVRTELARSASELMEKAYMEGTGAQQPLGLFTASDDGIGTARDVSTGNSTTEVKFDGLKEAFFSLKQQYWEKVSWIFHRTVMKQIAKEKDGNGRYLLQDSVTAGEPLMLLGRPVALSEFAPSTMTAGLYVGIIGDFSQYWIVDDMNVEIARAQELLIRDNQDLFLLRMSTDGSPVLAEAFARVKLAT